ncbi:hypothetical protein FQN54_009304 [Arachnomyces sp. PD_36]|nr:hypothetical protein FQN54_009304 [Arachnomyces sp. PD_36]
MSSVTISEANEGDLASLSTMMPRAFHPVNSFFLKLFPDTPQMQEWWHKIFLSAYADPSCRLLTAKDENTQDAGKRVVGVLFLQLCGGSDDKGAGFWTTHGLTTDHDAELFAVTIAPIIEPRARLMQGRRHYLLQLFGVDHLYQGRGIGKKLLQTACDIADQNGYDIFVEANMRAAPFYMRFQFRLLEEIPLPGETYSEGLLLRHYKSLQE